MSLHDDALAKAKSEFFEGLEHFERGRFLEAERHFQRSLASLPGRVSTQVNLAATYIALKKPVEAAALARQVLAVEPANADAMYHLGNAHRLAGRLDEALGCYRRILAADPANRAVRMQCGRTLQQAARHGDAIDCFDAALELDGSLAAAWSSRGASLRELGRLDEAAVAFEKAIAAGEDTEMNRYYLASVASIAAPGSAPPSYVEALFDDYADAFDQHLVGVLGYQAHVVLARQIEGVASDTRRHFEASLDLGCGTGLLGHLLRPITESLVGVDLSSQMMEKARALDVYDELVHDDLVHYLQQVRQRFDLIAAADVLIYIGELQPLFAAAREALVPDVGALLSFSLERAPLEDADVKRFTLQPSLRYAHSPHYVRALAAEHGFEVVQWTEAPIRQDQRESIPGMFVTLRLP